MTTLTPNLDQRREAALRCIEETRVAGRDTRHNRSDNLQAIRGLVRGEPHYTFGIKNLDRCGFDEVLRLVSSITKCSSDPNVATGGGYISPNATLKGLEEAAQRIAEVARRGGTFLLGTGHPGSMLLYYIELGDLMRRWGGQILEPARGAQIPPNLDLEYIRSVALTTDRCSLLHTHDSRAMEAMLTETAQVDLVVADHGYAGAAINAEIPVVTVMDTNDPALAVAKRLGADLTIIPLDDNRPLSCYLPIVDLIRAFAEATPVAGTPGRDATGAVASPHTENGQVATERASAIPLQMRDRLAVAARIVSQRAGPVEALDELIYSFMESYRDQFVQTHFAPDEAIATAPDPAVDLVIFKRLHDALRWAAVERLRLAQSPLTPGEIVAYLDRSAEPEKAQRPAA